MWTLPSLLSAHLHWPSNCFHLDWQSRSLPWLASLPSLAICGPEGNLHHWNQQQQQQQLGFNPAIIYTDMMLTVHFRDSLSAVSGSPRLSHPSQETDLSSSHTCQDPGSYSKLSLSNLVQLISPPVFQFLHLQNWSSDSGLLCKVLQLNASCGI